MLMRAETPDCWSMYLERRAAMLISSMICRMK
jgi:hypothetical protein